MRFKLLLLACINLTIYNVYAQQYIGAGNDNGIQVTSSDQHNESTWPEDALAANTINGKGLDAEFYEAARFLSMSTMGYEKYHVEAVVDQGIEEWLDAQLEMQPSTTLTETWAIWQAIKDSAANNGVVDDDNFRPNWKFFNYAYWDNLMRNEDLVHHRVAFALSQIFVISKNSELDGYGEGLAQYYDNLLAYSTKTFEEILLEVTLNPMMGFYLSHLNNQKADSALNIFPDENYAREIMQLFSIGLHELNIDGTLKLDPLGRVIPTYDQDDIRELAKVFTGLSNSERIVTPYSTNLNEYFGQGLYNSNTARPMMMYEEYHEQDKKELINGYTIPGGQSGMADIKQAVKHLSNHPNVGPFMAKRLIQRLVKSNPTPGYIRRVATVFNNNGSGVRGDMKAVIKAILMDGEARNCEFTAYEENSKMIEPFVRYTQFARTVEKIAPLNLYYNIGYQYYQYTNMDIFYAPSVFNFYLPDYAPVGEITAAGLVAPEFQIHNSSTSIGYLDMIHRWTASWGTLMHTWEEEIDSLDEVYVNLNGEWMDLAQETEALINELDRTLTNGRLTERTRGIIRDIVGQYPETWSDAYYHRLRLAIYIVLISPDYVISN